jgi:hypothetical protein
MNVSFILDKSGSMSTIKEATISGFNEYIQSLRSKDEGSTKFSLTLFDTEVTEKVSNVPLSAIEPLTAQAYSPDGNTALYDAACLTIRRMEDVDCQHKTNLVVILTDGEENASQKYTSQYFRDLVTRLQKTDRWKFVYLGANQDAWNNAKSWGFSSDSVSVFCSSNSGMRNAMSVVADASLNFLSASGKGMGANRTSFFSAADKTNLEDTK